MKNKKFILIPVLILMTIVLAFAACKKNGPGPIVVTDVNGEPVTDENGEKITVIPETEVLTVTDENGEPVTNSKGEVETTVKYIPQDVVIPLTDSQGNVVTDAEGNVQTTVILVPAESSTDIVIDVPVTDDKGNTQTDPNGNVITETVKPSLSPDGPSQNLVSVKTYGGENHDRAIATKATPDGGYVTIFKSSSKNGIFGVSTGTPTGAIVKFDKKGNIQWKHLIGGKIVTTPNGVDVCPDGSIVVVGETMSTDFFQMHGTEFDGFIQKYSADGKLLFSKAWGGSSNEAFNDVAAAPDGSIYAVGFAYSQDGDCQELKIKRNDSKAVVVKFDKNGAAVKQKGFGASGDSFSGVTVNNKGDIFVIGSYVSDVQFKNRGNADVCIYRLNQELSVIAGNNWGGSGIDFFSNIEATSDGGFVAAGSSNSADGSLAKLGNKGNHDAVVAKWDSSCNLVWVNSFAGSKDEKFFDLAVTAEGDVIAAGYSLSNNRDFRLVGNLGGSDSFVVRFKGRTGDFASVQTFGGSKNEEFNGVTVLTNGHTIAVGNTLSGDGYYKGSVPKSDGQKTVAAILEFRI